MAQTHEQVGRALVALSVVVAILVVVWLYRWEQRARTAEVVAPPGEGTAAPLSPQLKSGQQAFQKLCDSCHPGGGAGLGPSLLGLSQEQFIKATREGKGSMPAYTTFRLSDQDMGAMVAYVQGLAKAPAGSPTPPPTFARPPAIPHALEGRDACLACHGSAASGIPQVPANHAGRTNETCRLCHSSAPSGTPAATPTPAVTPPPPPAATPTAAPTPAPTPRPASGTPPPIPHTLEGRSACLACHASGVPGIPQMPPSHAGRTSQMCTLCHSPKK